MLAHPINQSADGHQLGELSLPFPFRVFFIRFLGKRQQLEEIKETKEMPIKLHEFC